jgi:hypothetical protein
MEKGIKFKFSYTSYEYVFIEGGSDASNRETTVRPSF